MEVRVRNAQVIPIALLLSVAASEGCGGEAGGAPSSPATTPDFSIGLSASSVTVSQGGISSPVSVSITPMNSFSANVQVSFSGLRAGVTANPSGSFSIVGGHSVPALFGAD
jgi:hypothetical protein